MNVCHDRPVTETASAVALLAATLLMAACHGHDVLVPRSDAPFLYLVLNQVSSSNYQPLGWTGQQALLLTSGSPLEPPRYRVADRFEMRRASDGAIFDWRRHPGVIDEPGTRSGIQLNYANYYLADNASGEGLGLEDLQPGETYELFIQTEGAVIRGTVTVPEAFTASLQNLQGGRTAVWPRVKGAAGYSVSLSTGQLELQSDTSFVLPPGATWIMIHALDPHLYNYMVDDQSSRNGIDNGYGVFGAMSSVRLPVAP